MKNSSGASRKWRTRDKLSLLAVCLIALIVWVIAQQDGPVFELKERLLSGERTVTITGYTVAEASEQLMVPGDVLGDQTPPFEPAFTELLDSGIGPVFVNRSVAVLSLDLAEAQPGEELSRKTARLYQNFAAAAESGLPILPSLDMLDCYTKQTDDRLVAAIEEHLSDGGSIFPGGKQGLLTELLQEVLRGPDQPGRNDAGAFLAAAIMLGEGNESAPQLVIADARDVKTEFLENPFNAKPIGLYTQSEKLKRIFQRDRLLQQPFGSEEFTGTRGEAGTGAHKYPERPLSAALRIAEVLDRRPDLLDAYTKYLLLANRLTNPDANFNLLDALQHRQLFGDEAQFMAAIRNSPAWERVHRSWFIGSGKLGLCLWPFATSKENQLFSRIFAADDPGGDVMESLILAVQSGECSLVPEPESGWYDYQVYALESLLLPDRAQEADKLLLGSRYKLRLRRAFEAMITQRRETQLKNLSMYGSDTKGPPLAFVSLDPIFNVEPQPTNYLRTARGYGMLRQSLQGVVGTAGLANLPISGTPDSVADFLEQAQATFTAMYLMSCNDIGMRPVLEPGEVVELDFGQSPTGEPQHPPSSLVIDKLPDLSPADAAQYRAACALGQAWVRALDGSQYMTYDPRVIVPVVSSMDGEYVHYWAVLGVQLAQLDAAYAVPPLAIRAGEMTKVAQANELLASGKGDEADLPWGRATWFIPVYVMREVRLKPDPPTREEFRAICDQGETADEIVALLEKEFGP